MNYALIIAGGGFFFPFIHAYYTNIYKNCL